MASSAPGCRHPPQSGAATTSQSKVKTATAVSATSACRRSNPRCWRGRMTLSWHTGHKADGLLLLAVPAAITRETLIPNLVDRNLSKRKGVGGFERGLGRLTCDGFALPGRGISRSSPDEGPLSDLIRQVGLG